jgi:thiamine pyrophosphate-dependent acetolactate synthase large subunit-like protein
MSATHPRYWWHYTPIWGACYGGYAERVEKPDEIAAALQRARQANEDGKAVLLEFITSEELPSPTDGRCRSAR